MAEGHAVWRPPHSLVQALTPALKELLAGPAAPWPRLEGSRPGCGGHLAGGPAAGGRALGRWGASGRGQALLSLFPHGHRVLPSSPPAPRPLHPSSPPSGTFSVSPPLPCSVSPSQATSTPGPAIATSRSATRLRPHPHGSLCSQQPERGLRIKAFCACLPLASNPGGSSSARLFLWSLHCRASPCVSSHTAWRAAREGPGAPCSPVSHA